MNTNPVNEYLSMLVVQSGAPDWTSPPGAFVNATPNIQPWGVQNATPNYSFDQVRNANPKRFPRADVRACFRLNPGFLK